MRSTHMSTWEQEEYALGQRTPAMLQHLRQCAACRQGVEQLEQGVAIFRDSAIEWSAHCFENRLQQGVTVRSMPALSRAMPALRWAAAAALLLLVLIPLSLLLMHKDAAMSTSAQVRTPVVSAPLADDALLQEVDDQVSEAVPDSMESLTHLVSTTSDTGETKDQQGRHHVQTN